MKTLWKWIHSGRAQAFFSGRNFPWVLAALAIALTLPSVWSGYHQDDHWIRERFQGFVHLPGVKGGALDTCVFGDGDPEQNRARMELGFAPWWTPPDWKIAFWRPLCSLTHWMDWRLFGDRAWVMHLHNLLWYGLLVFVLTLLYRRLLIPAWVAGLAGLMYLLDAAHAIPVGWIATRNAPLSSFFVVLVLYLHDRWRRDGGAPAMTAAWIALVLGLLSSEATTAAGAYLAAYALFVDRAGRLKGVVALLPYLVIVVVWRLAYHHLDYGVAATTLYTDPIEQPGRFMAHILLFLPVMLFGQLAASEPAIWNFLPSPFMEIGLAISVAFVLFVAWMLWPLLKRDKVARFWALGMVLSTLLVCTAIPQGRELMNPGIGGMALVAQFLGWRLSEDHGRAETRVYQVMARVLVGLWLFLHVAVSAVFLPMQSANAIRDAEGFERALNDSAGLDAEIANQTLLIVNTPADLLTHVLPHQRAAAGLPLPKHTYCLCAGVDSLEIERRDERTLTFRPDNTFLATPRSAMFCDPETHPMHVGQIIRLTGLEIEVTQVTPDGRPSEFVLRFDGPLESMTYRWVVFKDMAYVPFTPPAVGQKLQNAGPTIRDIVDQWFRGKGEQNVQNQTKR